MKTRAGTATAIAAAMLAAFSMSGCSARPTQAEVAAREGILLMGNRIEPRGLDPQLSSFVEEGNIYFALFEGLVTPNPEDISPEPGIAESWDISPDGRKYVFHLRKNALWSDGTPITGDDVCFAWQRLLEPGMASPNAMLLYPVAGAKAFNEGTLTDFSKVGVRAPDRHTVVVELESPTPWFTSILMHYATFPLPHRFIMEHGKAFDRSNTWARQPDLPCSGPFTLRQWVPNSLIEVAKNPRYWDAGKVRLNGIRFFPINSVNVEETAFRGGQLHVTDTVPVNKVAWMQKKKDPTLHLDPYLGVYFYAFNTKHPPLDNPDVREALSLAVNRGAITGNLLGGAQKNATSLTPGPVDGYEAPALVGEDIERAQKLLAKAGYPGGTGFPKLEILFNTSENHQMIAEAVQAMWKRYLGIDVSLRNEDFSSYASSRREGDFDILRIGWIADYPSATAFLDVLRSDSTNNFGHWKNTRFDELLSEAEGTPDAASRNRFCLEAETLLLNDAAVMPIYFYNSMRLISPQVKGWHANPMDWHPYKYLWLEPEALEKP